MRKQDHLIKLIKTLTPSEKKAFYELATKGKAPKSYMKLFDALQHAEHYDADALCKKLNKTKANLAHEKEYLQEVLMKTLRDHHSDIFRLKINNTMNDIYVLWYRGLFNMALDLIDKTIKEAIERGWFETLNRLRDARVNMIMQVYESTPEKFELIDKEIADVYDNLEKMKDHLLMQQTNMKLSVLATKSIKSFTTEDKHWLDEITNALWLQKQYVDPVIQVSQYEVIAGLNHVRNHWAEANKYREKILLLYEHEPVKTQLHEQSYVIGMLHVLNTAIKSGKTERAEELLHKIKARYYRFLSLNMAYLDTMFDVYYYVHIVHLTLIAFQAGKKNMSDVEAALKLFEDNFDFLKDNCFSLELLQTCQRAALLYFIAEDYDNSKKWFDYVLFEFEKDHAPEKKIPSKLSVIIIQFKYGNYALLASLSISATRYIKRWRNPTVLEKVLLKFFTALPLKPEKTGLNKKMKSLKESISAIKKETDADIYIGMLVDAWLKVV